MSRFVGADSVATATGPRTLNRNLTVDIIGTAHYASPEMLNDELLVRALLLWNRAFEFAAPKYAAAEQCSHSDAQILLVHDSSVPRRAGMAPASRTSNLAARGHACMPSADVACTLLKPNLPNRRRGCRRTCQGGVT